MIDKTKIPFNQEKLKLNCKSKVALNFDAYDAMAERYGQLEVQATQWIPKIEEIEKLISEKGIVNVIPFLMWILETSEIINEKSSKDVKCYINKVLRENMKLLD